MENLISIKFIFASVFYSFLGMVILALAFWLVDKCTPNNIYKEIFEHKNNALALLMGALMISLSIIIASAIH